ncbi:hypothetical protein NDU88_004067 [Pleurodeles waltl]|uniref:Uncharacterized protein n=1 Tax=Pleurodeles waltl TaxID=8319 RepID=A0AAV7TQ84_PLEWA|nr:hypothetical protein NDU88_004067 [Pleurodeles waltl]
MLKGRTQFCQDPDEAWTWLETYWTGTNKAQNEEPGPSCHRGKKQRTRGLMGKTRVTKPTQQKISQGKKAALQAVASLLEGDLSEGEPRPDQDSPVMGESTDDDSVMNIMEGLPRVTPQTTDDIA